jgi:hypothetical protein
MKRKRATLESAPPRDNRMLWENGLSERTDDDLEEDAIEKPLGETPGFQYDPSSAFR